MTWESFSREVNIEKVISLVESASALTKEQIRERAEELVADIWQAAQREQASLFSEALKKGGE